MQVSVPRARDERARDQRQRRRAVAAATIGSIIEWYDFLIFPTLATLVFGKLFFPASDPNASQIAATATIGVAFIARPVGAALFGGLGDRLGRKAMLIGTLAVMAVATCLIGFLPTYATIGIWAPILLVALRLVQGMSVGPEWAGAVLLPMEWASRERRGFFASVPQIGGACGLILGNLAILGMQQLAPGPAFLAWGWRVPFLLSAVLLGIGLYIRLGVLETPEFSRLRESRKTVRRPLTEALRTHPRQITAAALLRLGQMCSFYLFVTFSIFYGGTYLRLGASLMLLAVIVAELAGSIAVPIAGFLGDRVGRRHLYQLGLMALFLYGFVFFGAMDTRDGVIVVVAVVVGEIIDLSLYALQGALITEVFSSNVRYSGAGLAFQLPSIVAGFAPTIATILLNRFHSGYPIAMALAATVSVSLIGLWLLPQPNEEAAPVVVPATI